MIRSIDRERIERARRTPLDQKFLAGYELFQRAVALMEVGIRSRFPDADDEEVMRILRKRLDLTHQSDEQPDVRRNHAEQ